MPLIILSRRNITYREPGNGEINVLLVPGRDQIQVIKDLAGLGSAQVTVREASGKTVAATAGRKQIQLSRVHVGKRYIYGTLPNEISDLRQPVKVWLAEDYAPPQAQAFFYIFNNSVVVHGVREQDDEGHQNWRTAQLNLEEADPLRSIINAISDYALANPVDTLVVAVHNKLDLYEKLQAELATYNISPVPFSKLKPNPNAKPLYRHRDYTILYLTLALFGVIVMLASGMYLYVNYSQRNRLEQEVADIQRRISEIKLNQNIGQVSDPKTILQTMARPLNQQPSAVLDAAARAAADFGELGGVRLVMGNDPAQSGNVTPAGEGQINVLATVSELKDGLLLTQEQQATQALSARPWIREIRRTGTVGALGELIVTLQVDQAPSATLPVPVAEGLPTVIFTSGSELLPQAASSTTTASPTSAGSTFTAVPLPSVPSPSSVQGGK